MAKSVSIKHNLDDDVYVETLEKALKQATSHSEGPHATLSDPVAEEIRDRAYRVHERVMTNMIKEITEAVNK